MDVASDRGQNFYKVYLTQWQESFMIGRWKILSFIEFSYVVLNWVHTIEQIPIHTAWDYSINSVFKTKMNLGELGNEMKLLLKI